MYFLFLPLTFIIELKSVSEARTLRSKYFFRHPYQWINYGVYGEYGHISNMAIMAMDLRIAASNPNRA